MHRQYHSIDEDGVDVIVKSTFIIMYCHLLLTTLALIVVRSKCEG